MILELLDSAVEEKIRINSYEIYHNAELELLKIPIACETINGSNKQNVIFSLNSIREKYKTLLDRLPLSDFELTTNVCEFHENLYEIAKLEKLTECLVWYESQSAAYVNASNDLQLRYSEYDKLQIETDGFSEQCYCRTKCSFYRDKIGGYSNNLESLLKEFFEKYYKEKYDPGFVGYGD